MQDNIEEWHRFWQLLDEEEKAYVKSLLPEIDDRIKNHYKAAEQGAQEARKARGE